jgi:hypothetical protein
MPVLFKNLRFDTLNQTAKKIQLLFTHSSTMLSFYGALEIDKNPTDFVLANILTENTNRSYRISPLDPMNSNIAFVLYKCAPLSGFEAGSQYSIRVFLNEKLVKLARCSSVDCDLNEFLGFYERFVSECGSTERACAL